MRTATDPADADALAELAERVREKREAAAGCPVCRNWHLRDGEERDEDGHAPGCIMRGVTRYPPGGEEVDP